MDDLKTYQFPSIKKLGNFPTIEVDGNNRINYFCKWYIDSGITGFIPPLWQDFVIRFRNYWAAIPAFKKPEISENFTVIVHYSDDKAAFIACICVNDKKRYQVICDYAHMTESGKIQFTVMCDSAWKSAAEQSAEAAVTSILAVQAYILYHKPEVIDVYADPKPRRRPAQTPAKLNQSKPPKTVLRETVKHYIHIGETEKPAVARHYSAIQWQVRGHYRRYKDDNGAVKKVIYIAPHLSKRGGDGKKKKKAGTYVLPEKEGST